MSMKRNRAFGALKLGALVVTALSGLAMSGAAHAQGPTDAELSAEQPAAEIVQGTVAARVGMVASTDTPSMSAPMLEVLVEGRTVLRVEGVASGWDTPQGHIEILEIDPDNDTPEVVFTSYSGGAHCCTQVHVASADKAGSWHDVDLGGFDGEGGEFVDLDGDGLAEFRTYDNAFLYAFDCYACSSAPLKILAVRAGKMVDISGEPRFEAAHRVWLASMERRLGEAQETFSPGFFAGWIAEKALLGEGYEAWETMIKAYRGLADEGFESCPPDNPGCPQRERQLLPFPQALTAFLKEQGYL